MSSYPRSGNSLMQQLVNNYFENPWTSVDIAKRPLEKITGTPSSFKNWRYQRSMLWINQSSFRKFFRKINNRLFKIYRLDDWMALYDLNIPPYTKDCRYLLPGCLNCLTLENRRQLAEDKTYYFVKTHWKPYKEYLPNEYVIQIVRHPGNVLVSYFNFLKDFENSNKNLEEVILGEIPYGSWSSWHQEWNLAASNLGIRFLRLRFEETVLNKLEACEQIKNLISLNYSENKLDISFDKLREINPQYYRSGTSSNWKKNYTEKQLQIIIKIHRNIMQELNYF